MIITGQHFIGRERSAAGARSFTATNPATGEQLSGKFVDATEAEVDRALIAADQAFVELQTAPVEKSAALLDAIARRIDESGDALVERVQAETALPAARVQGERARTANQTRMFAKLVRGGSWVQARIDHAIPDRKPLPKPDIRTMFVGVGPAVVFGASNFPLAISVAGTDTVAAFAARCPVVVKAHPGHPGTCEFVAQIIVDAIAEVGLPAGMFSMLHGAGTEVGMALVRHPLTAVVAFTGSLRGGRALFDAAAARPNPIPVYAEMGSVNPVFILPKAAEERAEKIAEGYVQSVALGTGQFCTNPGMVLGVAGPALNRFLDATAVAASGVAPSTMLHRGIHDAFEKGVSRIAEAPGMELVAASTAAADGAKQQAATRIFAADVRVLAERAELEEEVFGPTSVVYRCPTASEMYDVARRMTPSLTATIHGAEQELLEHAELVRILERKVGRIIFNGFPTGLEPCAALHHGGPYPSTTHSHYTSVGTAAIYRFVRPVCYQGFPEAALPEELKEGNPRGVRRLVDDEVV